MKLIFTPCMHYGVVSGVLEKNMCKYQLVIIKAFISWNMIMLEFFGTYYESVRDRIVAMLKLGVSINTFKDGDVYNCRGNIHNNYIIENEWKDVKNVLNINKDFDNSLIQPLKQSQSFIKKYMADKKIYEHAKKNKKKYLFVYES